MTESLTKKQEQKYIIIIICTRIGTENSSESFLHKEVFKKIEADKNLFLYFRKKYIELSIIA